MKETMRGDEKILSYGDVILRRSDLDILQGPHFLNDRIIEFYFSYLASSLSPKILLVPPSISFWIQNCSDDLWSFIDAMDLQKRDLIAFPINDNEDPNKAESGQHWSVLVYDRKRNIFEHYDSLSRINSLNARQLHVNIRQLIGPPAESSHFTDHITPRQKNYHDCGVYVLAIVKELCSYHENGCIGEWGCILKEKVTSDTVIQLRKEILGIIETLSSSRPDNVSA